MLGALIGAGASLLGGIMGNKAQKKAQAAQNAYNDPAAIRTRYEAAGFNPLLGINNPSALQQPVQTQNFMGSAIADAGMMLSNGYSEKKELEIERARLDMEKERLEKLVTQQTLRPKTGGIYAGNVQTPGNPVVGSGIATAEAGAMTAAGPTVQDQELGRFTVDSGGNVGEANIYERKHPWFGTMYSQYPTMGQRVEDQHGDVLGAPALVPYVLSDIYHNLRGEYFDAKQQKWNPVLRNMRPEKKRVYTGKPEYADTKDDAKRRRLYSN